LRDKDIYVRTINANHTISSAPGNGRDVEEVVERCFQNREADYTALLAKTFQAIPGVNLPAIFKVIGALSETGLEAVQGIETIFDNGEERYSAAMAGRAVYYPFLGFLDIALVIHGLTKTLGSTLEKELNYLARHDCFPKQIGDHWEVVRS
jgi:hypothetical protein